MLPVDVRIATLHIQTSARVIILFGSRLKNSKSNRRKHGGEQSANLSRASHPVVQGPWHVNAGIFLLIAAATLGLYSQDLNLGFFSVDDPIYVVDNPWIRSLSAANVVHIFTAPHFTNYSPLHIFSYVVDYAFAQLSPFAFHLSNNIW